MKTFPATAILAVLLAAVPAFAAAETPKAPATPPPAGVPDPSLIPVPDVPGLPRVLLLGDSISMGYTIPVRENLAGRANVHRPAENCLQTARGLVNLDRWLGDGHWDVIHFNFGLHDLKYLDANRKYVTPDKGKQVATPDEYEKNLREMVARLKKTGAKLIFATTTPVPSGCDGRVQGDEVKFNEAALRVMRESGVAVDDLCAYTVRHPEIQLPHNVHFSPQGYKELAALVTKDILAALPPR